MKKKIIGIGQRRAGTSRRSGREYDMQPIYCTYENTNITGRGAEEIIFNHLSALTFPEGLTVGDIIYVSYNKSGFLADLTVIEKASASGKTAKAANADKA